jgi:hypothetical protein
MDSASLDRTNLTISSSDSHALGKGVANQTANYLNIESSPNVIYVSHISVKFNRHLILFLDRTSRTSVIAGPPISYSLTWYVYYIKRVLRTQIDEGKWF